MKTVKEWLMVLPDIYRQRALAKCINPDKEVDSYDEAINYALFSQGVTDYGEEISITEVMKGIHEEIRQKKINHMIEFLKKNGIEYIESNIPSVVIVNPNSDRVHVSLKKERYLIKCRFEGFGKWLTYKQSTFIEKFGNKIKKKPINGQAL